MHSDNDNDPLSIEELEAICRQKRWRYAGVNRVERNGLLSLLALIAFAECVPAIFGLKLLIDWLDFSHLSEGNFGPFFFIYAAGMIVVAVLSLRLQSNGAMLFGGAASLLAILGATGNFVSGQTLYAVLLAMFSPLPLVVAFLIQKKEPWCKHRTEHQ